MDEVDRESETGWAVSCHSLDNDDGGALCPTINYVPAQRRLSFACHWPSNMSAIAILTFQLAAIHLLFTPFFTAAA
jgi:hypothetical protein